MPTVTSLASPLLVAAAIAVASCGGKSTPGPSPIQLVTESEIASHETKLLQRLAANTNRHCERPVLRAVPMPGSAGLDLAALEQPGGKLGTCIAALVASNRTEMIGRSPAIVELEHRCGAEIEAAIGKAVSHVDACSPFQAGQRQPASVRPYLAVATFLGLRAQLRAEGGDADGAFELILDGIRFYQDLARGHTTLLVLMIATRATETLVSAAHEVAAGPKPPTRLDPLAAGLDRLLASEPTFTDTLAGTLDGRALYFGLAPLRATSWNPPGGWPEVDGVGPLHPEIWPVKSGSFARPRDEKAIMLVVDAALAAASIAACPGGASYRVCHAGLEQLVTETASRRRGHDDVADAFATLAARSTDPAEIRATIVDLLVANEARDFDGYAAKRAGAYARLAALRLHIEVLRHKRCPTTAELAAAPYMMRSVLERLGDSLITTHVTGGIDVKPPIWIHSDRAASRIACIP